MKFAKTLVFLALPLLAATSPLVARTDVCNNGDLQCCNRAITPNQAFQGLGLLGVLTSVTGLVGVDCSPLSVIGVGAMSCTQNTLCCTGNYYNGLVNMGCTPITLNL